MISECFEPGHFYSVIPHITSNYNNTNPKFLDLDFNDSNHTCILNELNNYLQDFDTSFGSSNNNVNTILQRKNNLQYSLMNGSFEWMDARILYYFLQKITLKRL